jgi:hypothetical protein
MIGVQRLDLLFLLAFALTVAPEKSAQAPG